MASVADKYACPIVGCTSNVRLNGNLCEAHRPRPGLYWARIDDSDAWTIIEVDADGGSQSIGWDAGAFPREIGPAAIRPGHITASPDVAAVIASILRARIGRVETFATLGARAGLDALKAQADEIGAEVAAALADTAVR